MIPVHAHAVCVQMSAFLCVDVWEGGMYILGSRMGQRATLSVGPHLLPCLTQGFFTVSLPHMPGKLAHRFPRILVSTPHLPVGSLGSQTPTLHVQSFHMSSGGSNSASLL